MNINSCLQAFRHSTPADVALSALIRENNILLLYGRSVNVRFV